MTSEQFVIESRQVRNGLIPSMVKEIIVCSYLLFIHIPVNALANLSFS
ncbi:hypothetical protein BFAG_00448 [Bacteroides fragilis 3_1_12]|uniref:Transmembrane protein n=1 Tax=Bacteroides fragilis 3_1_12 TaxID=457424 RepID=A0ABN0BG26_BACFG|nr:hypothetical protein BFAG_00448 [Bacteroides fragilis 3_1_12]